MKRIQCILLLLAFSWVTVGWAITELKTNDFENIAKKAQKLSQSKGAENVLLVFDIDNTLISTNGSMASDQWWSWQHDLLQKDPTSPALVSTDMDGLVLVTSLLRASSKTRLTQDNLSVIMCQLQTQPFPTLLLTARSPEDNDLTEMQLSENQLDFSTSALTVRFQPPAGKYKRPVLYRQGILYGSGQNKGELLKDFLAQLDQPVQAIIFVDDSSSNVEKVAESFQDSSIQIITYLFTREESNVVAFEKSDKALLKKRWQLVKNALQTVIKRCHGLTTSADSLCESVATK